MPLLSSPQTVKTVAACRRGNCSTESFKLQEAALSVGGRLWRTLPPRAHTPTCPFTARGVCSHPSRQLLVRPPHGRTLGKGIMPTSAVPAASHLSQMVVQRLDVGPCYSVRKRKSRYC